MWPASVLEPVEHICRDPEAALCPAHRAALFSLRFSRTEPGVLPLPGQGLPRVDVTEATASVTLGNWEDGRLPTHFQGHPPPQRDIPGQTPVFPERVLPASSPLEPGRPLGTRHRIDFYPLKLNLGVPWRPRG